ncbi:MAG: hypothetical protein ACRDL7_07585, partial [Gaiellaceae bacterium]
ARDEGCWKEQDAKETEQRIKAEQAKVEERKLKAQQNLQEMERENEMIDRQIGGYDDRRGRRTLPSVRIFETAAYVADCNRLTFLDCILSCFFRFMLAWR